MKTPAALLLSALLSAALLASDAARDLGPDQKSRRGPTSHNPPGFGSESGGYFGPGGGYNIPDFGSGNGWGNIGGGYGAGYGGPGGSYAHDGIIRPSVVCTEKGPCYKKKLTCPAKCFTSYSQAGRNYGGGGGGGGCTMDCKKKCIAYC